MQSHPPSSDLASPWTLAHFAWAILGGFGGALVGATVVLVTSDQGIILITTLLGQYAGHLLALQAVARRQGRSLTDLGLVVEPRDGMYIFFGVFLQFLLALLFTPLASLLDMEGSQQAITELLPSAEGLGVRIGLVLAVALLAPVVEETMFRGLLWQVVESRRGQRTALWVTALVFAVFHLLGIGSSDPLKAATLLIPQLFLVGLVLGRMVIRHRRLGVSIFIHAGFNLVAVIALLFAPEALGL